MALNWWPIAVGGIVAVVAVVLLAALLPMTSARRRLRPLANVDRLMQLPEYVKVARLRSMSSGVTLVVLTVMCAAAFWTAARPTGSTEGFDAAHPEDIMLCVGESVNDASTGEMLDYFARQADESPRSQSIGLTSVNRRVVPMTHDRQYAASRFAEYARADEAESAAFAPPITYTDYAAGVDDVLALCVSGFPGFGERSTHRRSMIYLGPSDLRDPGDTRPGLFSDASVRELVQRAGIQVNIVDTAATRSDNLRALAEVTGGRYLATDSGSLVPALDEIRANTPTARQLDGAIVPADSGDDPIIPLAIAVVSAAVLSVALMVLRR